MPDQTSETSNLNEQLRAPCWMTEEEACRFLMERTEYRDGDIYWTTTPVRLQRLKGRIAGYLNHGYRRISVKGFGLVQAHRLVYFMHTGDLPEMVDHIDGNPSNNAIENLRAATHAENCRNCKTTILNTSGRKGVYWSKSTSKWQASIKVDGKLKYLGVFKQFDDAVAARAKAEKEIYGEFAR